MAGFRDSLDKEFRSMLSGEFADDAIVRASLEVVVRVRGIYDNTYLEIDPNTGATVASKKPRLTVFLGDVSFEVRQGHIVTVSGRAYRVRDIQPDGLGSASLYLDPAKAADTLDVSTFDDDGPDPSDSAAIDARADEIEDLSVEDSAEWEGIGSRDESDSLALDDLLLVEGAGTISAIEVAPRAGAWIETLSRSAQESRYCRRAPRGRVD